ncbi:mechanosensitive ion channel family protein [Pedomonas sp. V897]|uniref:mechanosensitive ion channel family protein n=1 Tax=Pedomonas sp. V897 TaxID=3446482 RepID=UPI003EE2A99F
MTASELIAAHPILETLIGLAILGLAAWVAYTLTRVILIRLFGHMTQRTSFVMDGLLIEHRVVHRLAYAVPSVIIHAGAAFIPGLPEPVRLLVENVASAFTAITLVLALGAFTNVINDLYNRRPDAANRPIKGYLQLVKIVLYTAGAIVAIAFLIERSPMLLLSSLGALAAVLTLVFKDTLLSLVASVQLTTNDMVRVGDWIEMPQVHADGAVIDIALHTVKVQNWDKTITTIPTYRLISDSFKNWRGMFESGGRRIKRAIPLDLASVRFLTAEERARLRRFTLLRDYLDAKQAELDAWNASHPERASEPVNARRLTNIGCFRAYVQAYLKAHPGIHQEMMMLVRQMPPGPAGVPLEIYCFTNTVVWVEYEAIQSDIFDHLFAILPEFGLKVFQQPSGWDIQQAADASGPEAGRLALLAALAQEDRQAAAR